MSGPTLIQVNRRRWWIAITSVIENLMFAAVLLGWSSLLLMLKNEGFYANLCVVPDEHDNITSSNTTSSNTTSSNTTSSNLTQHTEDEIFFTPSGYPTCAAQDEILNRYFSIGSSLLSGVTVILGVIMDKYGSRMIRLSGTLAFMASCVLFAIGSLDTEHYSILIVPAICLNGMGGVVYIFTSFPVPNLFAELRSTMIALMIGSYSASAVMYMLFKAAYDAGVSFQAIMCFHASVGFLTFLNCYFNCPGEPIPGPDDISYAIKLHFSAFRFEHKITGKSFLRHTSTVGRRMSSVDIAPVENHNYLTSVDDMRKGGNNNSSESDSFLRVLATPCILLSFVTMCLTQLRLIAYMGSLEVYLKSSAEKLELSPEETIATVDFYTFLFGLFQINCFFMAPVIGTIMDWKLKVKVQKPKKREILGSETHPSENGNGHANGHAQTNGKVSHDRECPEQQTKHNRKHQQVMNLARAFMLTNILLVLFGIIIMFEEVLPIQVVAFIIHTAVRTFLHSSIGGLYACMYHFSHFGKLTGLASFLSAMFILIQDPLFVVVNSTLGGDPFWINFVLLILSVTGFGLPIYLWNYARKMNAYEPVDNTREMFTIGEDEEEDPAIAFERPDDQDVVVSSMALAF